MSTELHHKVAIVTGGASGIGAAIVEALSRAGATVVLTDRNPDAGREMIGRLANLGLAVEFREHDVSDEAGWESVIAETVARHRSFDVLVNNAGIHIGELFTETSIEDFRAVHQVNVDGVFLGMKHAARAMRPGGIAGQGGSIINMSSIAGIKGTLGHSAYGSTKGAVRALSRHGAVEFANLGYRIRVNSVHPGIVSTAMGEDLFKTYAKPELLGSYERAVEATTAAIPLKRIGTPQDVAPLVTFLASDASAYITGAEFVVDGGVTAR